MFNNFHKSQQRQKSIHKCFQKKAKWEQKINFHVYIREKGFRLSFRDKTEKKFEMK